MNEGAGGGEMRFQEMPHGRAPETLGYDKPLIYSECDWGHTGGL